MKKHLLLAALLLLMLTGCTPKTAQGSPTPPVTPTPTAEAEETPAPPETLKELLLRITAEEIGSASWGGPNECVTAEELAPLLRAAAVHAVDHAPMTMNGTDTDIIWAMDVYVGEKHRDVYSSEDAVHLFAGLEENVVEAVAGANLPKGRVWLEDEALYQLLRTQNDTPDRGIDEEAYAAYRELVDGYLNRPLPEVEGVTFARVMTSFRQVAEAPELDAVVYCVASVLTSDPPEEARHMMAGGAYVDSQLRVVGENEQNNLVVVGGVPAGFVSAEWLAFDGLTQYATAEELAAAVAKGNL